MSAFGIFALILTTAYIIYFSVVIIRDVTSSRKSAGENSGTETFDTTFAEEQSVEVIETETGFAVGDNNVNAEPVAAIETTIPESSSSDTDEEAQVENPGSVDPVSQDNFDPWKLFNSDPRKFWPTGSFLFWIIWLCRI